MDRERREVFRETGDMSDYLWKLESTDVGTGDRAAIAVGAVKLAHILGDVDAEGLDSYRRSPC